uniref:GABA permease n=1 Tax=Lygus hesperus TaxID=30085 RepID=A0A0A9WBC9_LYGHE
MDSFTTSSTTERPDAFQTFGSYDNDRTAYMKNPLSRSHLEKGDFTPFYVTITICTLIGFALILLNVSFAGAPNTSITGKTQTQATGGFFQFGRKLLTSSLPWI